MLKKARGIRLYTLVLRWIFYWSVCQYLQYSKAIDCNLIPLSSDVITALSDLYYGTNGDHWVYPTGEQPWNLSQLYTTPQISPCNFPSWYGIYCTNCYIASIQMNTNINMSGTLSESISNLRNLTYISINNNHGLRGTLPSSISTIPRLANVILDNNRLSGTLPSSWGNLSFVQSLKLTDNLYIHGKIPSTWGKTLLSVNRLDLSNNQLSQSIPSSLFSIPRIAYLDLSDNRLTSTLPSAIGNMKKTIRDFRVGDNRLTGTIPAEINTFTILQVFVASNNFFESPLPTNFQNSANLRDLELDNNLFKETFPKSVLPLTKLSTLYLYNNFFSSSIPREFGLYNRFNSLNFFNNYFTGKLPKALFQNNTFLNFDIHANFFTGPLGNFHQIGVLYFYVNNNLLTGTIPWLYPFKSAMDLRFDNNQLSGTLPSEEFPFLTSIQNLNFSFNYLSGTLPKNISKLSTIELFDVRSNNMIGTIGNIFHPLKNLYAMNLQNNYFNGSLDNVFNTSTQLSLISVDVSDNALTGEIPSDIFLLPTIELISLTKNCFHMSTFPSTMCEAKHLLLLSLNGLHTEPVCQERIFPSIPQIQTFQLNNLLHEHIPSCLFTNMTNLTTLHISGNNLQGPLPNVDFINPSLVNLALSHNQLTGTIPSVYQTHAWKDLDLSFNKLTGTLKSRFTRSFTSSGTAVQLNNNRISGTIPSALTDAYQITLLQGNIFSCDGEKTSLPANDSLYTSYNCGSEVVDNSFYTWIGWIVVILVSYLSLLYLVPRMKAKPPEKWTSLEKFANVLMSWIERDLSSYWEIYNSKASFFFFTQEIYQFYEFGAILREVRTWCAKVTLLILLVFFPIYPLLSLFYSTYYRAYAWVFSLAFLSGTTPSIIILVIMILFLFVMFSEWFVQFSVNLYYLTKRMMKKEETIHKIVELMKVNPGQQFLGQQDGNLERDSNLSTLGRETEHSKRNSNRVIHIAEEIPAFMNPMLLQQYRQELKEERRQSKRLSKTCKSDVSSGLEKTSTAVSQGTQPQEDTESAVSPIHVSNIEGEVNAHSKRQHSKSYRHDEEEDDLFDPLSLEAWKQSQKQIQQDIKLSWKWYLVMITGLIVNIVVVLAVNMSFVALLSDKSISSAAKQFISFLVSIFKILWNSIVMEAFQSLLVSTLPGHQDHGESIITAYMLWITLFNNIIVPCIAVAVISSDCFYYAFVQDDPVITTFTFPQCDGYSFTSNNGLYCVSYVKVDYTTEYDPPYTYSYQCSSSLLTNFVDIFIYRFLITTFVNPLVIFPLKYLQEKIYYRYGEASWLYKAIISAIPPLLQPLASQGRKEAATGVERSSVANGVELQALPKQTTSADKTSPAQLAEVKTESGELQNEDASKADNPKKDEPLVKFKAKNTVINLISDIAVLLTFGVIFPPIALIGCLSIVTNTIFIQVALGRLVVLSRSQPALIKSILRINAKCGGIRWLFMNSLKSLSLLLALFWSCFLVDIYGDAKGWVKSIWVIAVMGCVPAIIYVTNRVKRYCFPQNWKVDYWTQSLVLRPEASPTTTDNADTNEAEDIELTAMKQIRPESVRFSMIYPSAAR